MNTDVIRKKLHITGLIQGVGFRPFIYKQATQLALKGWASNTGDGVTVDLEGVSSALDAFIDTLRNQCPVNSKIESLEVTDLPVKGYIAFELRESDVNQRSFLFMSPDLAICEACRDDIFDPTNRRYQYAFTSCSQCGPRYSIINALPYDRERTAMHTFPLCEACQREYDNPEDRRFHAQTIACPVCGPTIELLTKKGEYLADNISAIKQAAEALKKGDIVALKGIGGFQLLADATNLSSIQRLRLNKARPAKPFAVMCRDIQQVETLATPSEQENRLLLSAAAPIVLMDKKTPSALADSVAPDNSRIGIMLPCSPLHHLLLYYLPFPIVATSGNLSNEPIYIDNQQAIERLGNIADFFLVHNRQILRPVDDSVVQTVYGLPTLLRSARGYAPITIKLPESQSSQIQHTTILAVGGHLKNTFAFSSGDYVIVSQHNGDLETFEAVTGFKRNIADLSHMVEHHPDMIARDRHPAYASSYYAESRNLPMIRVQHHHAHLMSCMAEHNLEPPLLGVVWDGIGLGDDDTLWGGEFFTLRQTVISRIASLREFSLPGGASAVKEPRRTALAMLWEYMGDEVFEQTRLVPVSAFKADEKALLQHMLSKQVNSPRSSSIGRLFDCVASLLDLCQISSFEGQAAQRLEQCIASTASDEHYPLLWQQQNDLVRFDWQPLLHNIIDDISHTASKPLIACKFHNTLVEMVVDIAYKSGLKSVVLSGGSFQNRYLTETIISRLSALDIETYWQQKLPSNDGGLALGQLAAVRNRGTHHVLGNSR